MIEAVFLSIWVVLKRTRVYFFKKFIPLSTSYARSLNWALLQPKVPSVMYVCHPLCKFRGLVKLDRNTGVELLG